MLASESQMYYPSIDALSLEELEQASVENSSEIFLALSTLTRIKGQLCYLKVLILIYYKLLFSFICVSLAHLCNGNLQGF